MQNIDKWISGANNLLMSLSTYGQLGECRFRQGDIQGCEVSGYDDSSWKRVMAKAYPIPGIATESISGESEQSELELSDWSMVDGPAALRKMIQIPDNILGLSTAGTKVYFTLTMLAPIEVYFDGKLAAAFKYWGDSRHCEIIVTDSFKPGTGHLLVIKTPQNDGDAHLGISLNIGVAEDAMLDLSTAVSQLEFAKKLLGLKRDKSMQDALSELDALLDPAGVDNRDWDRIKKNLADIDAKLTAFDAEAKKYKVHLIGHAHIDMNWLWDMEDTKDICVRDFATICDILDENPDVRFSQSQSVVYDIVDQIKPELLKRAKDKIASGQWDVTAATWTEHDLNTSTGEVFARHNLMATKYAKEVLGAKPSRICWEPDTFGHPATIPNILAKAGIRYYYHFRNGQEYPMYWWEGTDGSRVLDFCFGPYNNAIRPTNIMPAVNEFIDKLGMYNSMFVYGVGDHGGGPTRNDIRIKRYLDKKPALPTFTFATAHEFYESALAENTDYPVHKGEQNFIFEGCYTTKTKIKKYLRDGEARLLDAEALMAYAAMNGQDVGADNTQAMEAWKHVLFNGFHDISCGCNIAAANEYNYSIGQKAIDAANELCSKYLSKLSSDISSDADSHVIVWNQLAHPRTDVVRFAAKREASCAVDSNGSCVPVQKDGDKLAFIASDVPAFGYKIYKLSSDPAPSSIKVAVGSSKVDGSVHAIDTDVYRMEISARTGTIVKLYHKLLGRNILMPLQGEPEVARAFRGELSSNLLQVSQEEPHIMSAWMIGNKMSCENLLGIPEFKVLECGNAFAKLRVSRKYKSSTIDQDITVYNGFDRVDFELNVDWQEIGHYSSGVPFMKVGFTADIEAPQYTFETPMGWTDRSEQGRELPSLRFVNLYGNGYGLSLYNDCKFGFSVDGSRVNMSVVRNSYSPDAVPDKGVITCKYAIQPHAGVKDIPSVMKGAAAFNHPVFAALSGAAKASDATGLLCVDKENIVVSTVKPAADNNGVVVRLVESQGVKTDVTLKASAAFTAAFETNIAEEAIRALPINDNAVMATLRPFENITIRLIP